MKLRKVVPIILASTVTLVMTTACGSSSSTSTNPTSSGSSAPVSLKLLIASSGDAETASVKAAAAKWASATGNKVDVLVATDINQELGQAFAGSTPPDVFYVDAGKFADYAKAGSLEPYGDQMTTKFVPALQQTFTYDSKFYCAPKDYSTLALIINTAMWKAAGLTDSDIPKDWNALEAVATKLTTKDHVGLVVGNTRDRVGAFMKQAGGWFTNADASAITTNAPENLAALDYVKKLLAAGVAKYPKAVDAGWGGEAFGLQKAAMVIEGNWIKGAIKNDYAKVAYQVAELPAGSAGKGTLLFTQCWGVAAAGQNKPQAIDLVKSFVTDDQQMAFAEGFGVMPSSQSAQAAYGAKFPADAAFLAGGQYGQGPVAIPGFAPVLAQFDVGLDALSTTEPQKILTETQKNGEAALADSK